MTIDIYIIDRLKAREEEWCDIQRCLAVNLCPRCGSDLVKIVDDKVCSDRDCGFSSNAANFFKRMYDPSEVKSR
jgi:hypothetical protein